MNWASKPSAIRRASVVLPTPGGPQKIMECGRPDSKATRSGLSGPSRCDCPTTSASVRGRRRSAGHVRPMGRIGREEIVAHWQQMGNKARVSRQHYTTAGYRPPPNESPCPGTPNLQRDRASPSRRPSSCGIHCFPGTDGGPWRVRPHLLKSRNQPFDFNGRFCQASGSLKRLRCAGVSTFGSSKAAANGQVSQIHPQAPGKPGAPSFQADHLGRITLASCVSRLRNRRRRCPAGRQNGPRMRQAASFRAMLRSRSLLPSCGMHKTADHPPIPE